MSAAFDFADRCIGRTLEVLAEGCEDGQYSVSYTHLDVYKRQVKCSAG